jgi:hypothetical protein
MPVKKYLKPLKLNALYFPEDNAKLLTAANILPIISLSFFSYAVFLGTPGNR